MAFNHKHLIDITEYSADDIMAILETALKFKEVNEAYSILSDPEKKSKHDQFGFAGVDPNAGFGGGFGGGSTGGGGASSGW